jgi:uncharacterized phage protein (TIGR02218 family)
MPSQDYIDKEEASERRPVEIYHIWSGSTHYYNTSSDAEVDYDSQIWLSASLQRETIEFSNDLSASEVNVTFDKANPAISKYVAQAPVTLAWIKIMKLFRDQSPIETQLVFLGQILAVSVKGPQAQATCKGIEYLLQNPALKDWYQPECNHTVFSAGCGLDANTYKISPTITLDATETILTAAAFGAEADGYWTMGKVTFGDDVRYITAHSGNSITLMNKFADLETSDTVEVTPGCDGSVDTCKDKYDNLINFLGFPFVPIDNPAMWIGKE